MSLSHRAKYPQASWSQPKIFLWGKKWSDALKSLPTIEIFIIFALFSSDQKSQSLATMENYFINSIEHFYHDDGYWSLHIYMKPMIPLQFPLSPPIIHKSGNNPQFWKNVIPSEKRSLWPPKKWKWEPKKKVLFRNNQGMYILQKTRSNLVNSGLRSLISDLQTPIGGHHPVLYFTTQITEKYSTAMCYQTTSIQGRL